MEKLKIFIQENGLKYKGLAYVLGIGQQRFYKLLEGKTNITLAEALKIEEFTHGKVVVRDFLK